MKLPSDLSGQNLATVLCRAWGYVKVNQVGSHIILQTQAPTPHRIAIAAHKALRIDTLNGILKDVANHKDVHMQAILDSLSEGSVATANLPRSLRVSGPVMPGFLPTGLKCFRRSFSA